jgi:hypothetical protein
MCESLLGGERTYHLDGLRVRAFPKKRNWSRETLGEKSGLHQARFGEIERRHRRGKRKDIWTCVEEYAKTALDRVLGIEPPDTLVLPCPPGPFAGVGAPAVASAGAPALPPASKFPKCFGIGKRRIRFLEVLNCGKIPWQEGDGRLKFEMLAIPLRLPLDLEIARQRYHAAVMRQSKEHNFP